MPFFPPDYHTHNHYCRHAGGCVADYVKAAEAKGIPEIACTDHIPFPDDPAPAIRMTHTEFSLYLEDVRVAAAGATIPVLLGLEADYSPLLAESFLPQLLAQAEFDVVLGSIHTGPYWDLLPEDPAATPDYVRQIWQTYFAKVHDMVKSGLYDVCSHFDLPKRRGIFLPEAQLREIVLPVLDSVAAQGMSIEINTSGLRHGAQEPYPAEAILRWMYERGISITFGSDAHAPEDVGQFFEEAVALAARAGYTDSARYRKRQKTGIPFSAMETHCPLA